MDSGFSVASAAKTKACFLIPLGQRDKDSLTHHMHHLIVGDTRDKGHVGGLRLPRRLGLHSSHSQPQPKLKMHGGESNKVCLTQEHPKVSLKAIYRNGSGNRTMDMILLETSSSISPTCMKYAKMHKLFLIQLCALFVIGLPLHGGKETIHSFNTWH